MRVCHRKSNSEHVTATLIRDNLIFKDTFFESIVSVDILA